MDLQTRRRRHPPTDVRFGRAQRTRAAGMRDESGKRKSDARCGGRTSSLVDARCSSIFLVFTRRQNPPTVPPTVVPATRWCQERQDAGHDPSARLAGVFRHSGSGNPAAARCTPPLRFVRTRYRPPRRRASATSRSALLTVRIPTGLGPTGNPSTTTNALSRFQQNEENRFDNIVSR